MSDSFPRQGKSAQEQLLDRAIRMTKEAQRAAFDAVRVGHPTMIAANVESHYAAAIADLEKRRAGV